MEKHALFSFFHRYIISRWIITSAVFSVEAVFATGHWKMEMLMVFHQLTFTCVGSQFMSEIGTKRGQDREPQE